MPAGFAMPPPEAKKWRERRERVADAILPILKQTYPGAKCSLDYKTPLQLLVATILSAQCTDERVNAVTKTLFKKYKSAEDYAAVGPEELERDIQSTGFYRNKTKSIRRMAQALVERHRGKVPRTMGELTDLRQTVARWAGLLRAPERRDSALPDADRAAGTLGPLVPPPHPPRPRPLPGPQAEVRGVPPPAALSRRTEVHQGREAELNRGSIASSLGQIVEVINQHPQLPVIATVKREDEPM